MSKKRWEDIVSIEEVPNLAFGLSEQRLRERLEEQLVRYMRAEGEAPTIKAIASAIARVVEADHLEMAEQLERAGVRLVP